MLASHYVPAFYRRFIGQDQLEWVSSELARSADRLVDGSDACLVFDDTSLPKKGTRSVGVARQYCGQLGRKANCRSLVSLVLARGEVPVSVALNQILPEARTPAAAEWRRWSLSPARGRSGACWTVWSVDRR